MREYSRITSWGFAGSTSTMKLDHFNIVTRDMTRAVAFYRDVLGFAQTFETTLEGEWIERVTGLRGARARCVFLQLPGVDVRLELLQYLAPAGEKFAENAQPNTMGLRHLAFETSELDALSNRLHLNGMTFVSAPVEVPFPVGPQGLKKRLCYFRDPDGVLLELAEYSRT
jgi:glyoxylase I family protein